MYKVNVIPFPFLIIMMPNFRNSVKPKESSFLPPAHGGCGARTTINKLALPKNLRARPKQAGKKEGGLGEGIFARLLTAPKARHGAGAFPPFCSRGARD